MKDDMIAIDWTPVANAQKQCSRKVVQRKTKTILRKTDFAGNVPKKKFSFNAKDDVILLYELAAYLYVFEEYQLCWDVCCLCDHVVFEGNYWVWELVEHIRILKVCILKRNGEEAQAQAIIDALREHEAPMENYARLWDWLYNRAVSDFAREYAEAKEGRMSPSGVRFVIMGCGMNCLQYIQMGYLPEMHELMKECSERIFEFLHAEEK